MSRNEPIQISSTPRAALLRVHLVWVTAKQWMGFGTSGGEIRFRIAGIVARQAKHGTTRSSWVVANAAEFLLPVTHEKCRQAAPERLVKLGQKPCW